MDSFYDAPRRPPQHLIREALTATPVVPEVSVLCTSNVQKNTFTPYNHWKMQQVTSQKQYVAANKENLNHLSTAPNASILKKQVRFEGPSVPFAQPKIVTNPTKDKIVEKDKFSFEQMYMANIPNRKLDLSIIDLPNKRVSTITAKQDKVDLDIKTNNEPKTYKDFLGLQKTNSEITFNDSVTDIFNYKRNFPLMNRQEQIYRSDKKPSSPGCSYSPKIEQKHISNSQKTSEIKEDVLTHKRKNGDNSFFKESNDVDNRLPYLENVRHNQPVNNTQRDHTKIPLLSYYGENNTPFNEYGKSHKKTCDSCDAKSKAANTLQPCNKSDDAISVKDLLNIISQQNQQIAQQNEQLLLLQKQVSTLICRQNEKDTMLMKSIEFNSDRKYAMINEASRQNYNNGEIKQGCLTSTQHEDYNSTKQLGVMSGKTKNKVSNFSIGVMTSFEVSIRNPPNKADFSPKIEEICEISDKKVPYVDCKQGNSSFDSKTLPDVSMVFKEPITVRERSPSPQPSIKINMKDFEDSDCEDEESSQIGATFYNNLMSQVNKILQKAQIQTREDLTCNIKDGNIDRLKNETMHKVKEATIKHLRNIGVEVPSYDDSSACSLDDIGGKSYDQEDISFTVKQLLMKYLPDDHLAKIGKMEPQHGNPATFIPKEKIGAIKNRPEFSFATVQYMKKYNLMAKTHKDNSDSPDNILDMTKLKQQPKLL